MLCAVCLGEIETEPHDGGHESDCRRISGDRDWCNCPLDPVHPECCEACQKKGA